MTDDSEVRIAQLEARVQQLESDLDRLRARVDHAALSALPPPPPILPPGSPGRLGRLQQTPAPPTGPSGSGPVSVPEPGAHGRRYPIESETVLKWGGVALVVLAVGFAVSTAISRGWIGPELQLVGAVGVSLALVATGLRLRPTRLPWTHALCSGGVLALFTTVASNLFVDQTSDDVAFACTAAIGIGGWALARLVPSGWVGGAALMGGLTGWLVIADGEPPFHATLAWIVALVVVAVALSLENRWFALRLLAHGVGLLAVLGMAGEAESVTERLPVLVAATLVAASLTRLPSIGDMRSIWQQLEIQLVTVVAPWAFAILAVTLDLDRDAAVGAVAIAVAGGTVLIAVGVRPWIHPGHFVSMLVGGSVTLSIGLALLLSASVAFVALAIQGAGLVILGNLLGKSIRILINAAVVSLIAAIFVIGEMIEAWTDDASVGDDIAHLAIIAALVVAGWQTGHKEARQVGAAVGLGLVLVWLGSVLVHLPQGQAVVSVSWAIVGTAVLVAGAVKKVPGLGAAGLAVLALTVAKLLTVDLREVDTLWRAGLFFMVGFGIMRLGFLLPRLTGAADDHLGEPIIQE